MSQTKAQLIEGLNINTSAPADALVIDSSGNVGIGTSSPSKPLHIYQTADAGIRIQNSTTGTGTTDGILLEATGSDGLFWNYESGNLRFATGNSERLRIDSSGRMGLGTSSPTALLHLNATSPVLRLTGSSVGNCEIQEDGSTLLINVDSSNAKSNSALVLRTDNTERLRIDSSGVIRSIGNTSGTYENLLLTDGTSNSTTKRFGINCVHYNTAEEDFTIIHGASSSSENVIKIGGNNSATTTNDATNIRFYTAANQTTTSSSERMRIDSSGRVLIGLSSGGTSPLNIEGAEGTAQLRIGNTNAAASDGDFVAGIDFHIKDNNDATGATCTSIRSIADQNHTATAKGTALAFHTTADDTTTLSERMRIDNSGNVGIGRTPFTSAPGYMLQLRGPGTQTYISFSTSSQGDTHDDGMIVGSDNSNAYIVQRENASLIISTNNTERLRVLAGGGLTFNGDTAQANALDDYEQGSYTPLSSGDTISITVNEALYTKIGNRVWVDVDLVFATNSSGFNARITLPFAMSANDHYGSGIAGWADNTDGVKFHVGGATAYLMKIDNTSAGNNHLTFADMSGKRVIGGFYYETA